MLRQRAIWVILICFSFGFIIVFYGTSVILSRVSKTSISLSPSPEETFQAKKTVENFLEFYQKSSSDETYAKKARDLLTISAQAKLLTYQDDSGQKIEKLTNQLDRFLVLSDSSVPWEIHSAILNGNKIEVRERFSYPTPRDKLFLLIDEGRNWLIDEVR